MESELIKIGGIERFSLVDFPGKIAAVVFLQGCPWKCPFCFNTALQDASLPGDLSWEKLKQFFIQRKGFLDAVVFSGGEPLLQENLPNAMREIKELGYLVAMHSGCYLPERLAKVLPIVDWVGMDIKAPLTDERYQQATGSKIKVENILSSLDLLLTSGKSFETRTTCDPRILAIEDIYAIAGELKKRGVKSYHLQKYRPVPSDTATTESDCEKFFQDKALHEYLKASFEDFDLRS